MNTSALGIRRARKPTLPMMLAVGLLATFACTPAKATLAFYSWNSGGGLSFTTTHDLVISGHFTYDTVTDTLSNFDTSISSASFPGCVCVGSSTVGTLNHQNGVTLINFGYNSPAANGHVDVSLLLNTPNLGGPGPFYLNSNFGPGSVIVPGLGGAYVLNDSSNPPFLVQASDVPEPETWSLVLTGLVLSGVGARVKSASRRARSSPLTLVA